VAGGREHVQVIHTSLGIGFSIDSVEQRCIHSLHEMVSTVVIIAEKRCFVLQSEAESFMTFEVAANCVHQLFHGYCALVEHLGFYSRKAVRDSTNATALYVVGIVAWASIVIIFSFDDTVSDDH